MGWRWYEGRFINDEEYEDEEAKKFSRVTRFMALLVCIYSFWNGNAVVGSLAVFLVIFPKIGCVFLIVGLIGWILFAAIKGFLGF